MKNLKTILLIIPFIIGISLIRLYESSWFYDPFLNYFKGDYQNHSFPEFNQAKLVLNMTFRYILNTFLSLGIIYIIFKNKEFVKVSSILYFIFFIVLILSFLLILNYSDNSSGFLLFYIRRFLIQPLFLLLFLPAFYFQTKSKNN